VNGRGRSDISQLVNIIGTFLLARVIVLDNPLRARPGFIVAA
jgi:hypothetical protein